MTRRFGRLIACWEGKPPFILQEIMAEITLPRWMITNKCMPAGHRTAKKPVLVIPVEERFVGGSGGSYRPPTIKDVFDGWEYRFWAMATLNENTPCVVECRCCGSVQGHTRQARVFHHAQGNCTKRLCSAYKLLLLDKRCVICNMKTFGDKYGVPLCCSGCIQAWCEAEPQPAALLNALLLVGVE